MQVTSKPGYRADIQGLRAIAALLVAIYHIWLGRVSGGVDVFFVVSGFLITGSLVSMLEHNRRIDLLAFWSGLARRLLPMSLLVLACSVAAGIMWLPQVQWERTIKEVMASALYLENWYLNYRQVDYLERDAYVSPLQHYWAMSLQGQIYVIWPLLLAAAALIARRLGAGARTGAWALLGVTFCGSLAYSIATTAIRQPFAYFDTFARIWEFAIGGAVALLPMRVVPGPRIRSAAGWLGLLAILSCGVVLHVSRLFPGYAALWPTLAAALIVLAGRGEAPPWGVGRLLAWRPLARLGDASYGIYLWHWPLFAFYRVYTGTTRAGLFAGIALIALSIAIAMLATRFVERPLRFAPVAMARPLRSLWLGATGVLAVVILAGFWGLLFTHARAEDVVETRVDDPDFPGAAALEPGYHYAGEASVTPRPGPLAVRADLPRAYKDGCQASERRSDLLSCIYGDTQSATTLALVGGSHSTHWLPALRRIAERRHWRIVTYLKDMCRLGLRPARTNTGEPYPSCDRWRAEVLRRLASERPYAVFTTATYAGEGAEIVPADFVSVWQRLTSAGIKVIAVRDTPYPGFPVAECVELRGAGARACSRPRQRMLAARNPAESIADLPSDVTLLDFTRYFCPDDNCPPVVGNVLVYRDDNHITRTYMRTLSPVVERELLSILPSG